MAADEGIAIVVEMNERAWGTLSYSLNGLTDDEARWQPHPASNTIAAIVRHLRIESERHVNSIVHGTLMPFEVPPELQRQIDAVPHDFAVNRDALIASGAAFIKQLKTMTAPELRERTARAYDAKSGAAPHLLGYHQAMHLMTHCGQIRMIRNLYSKNRGERPRFFPENPTFQSG